MLGTSDQDIDLVGSHQASKLGGTVPQAALDPTVASPPPQVLGHEAPRAVGPQRLLEEAG